MLTPRDRAAKTPVEVLATRLLNVTEDREPLAARLAAIEARLAALEALADAAPSPPRR